MIQRRVAKSGDGSHFLSHENAHKTSLWGYGDKDLESEDMNDLKTMKK